MKYARSNINIHVLSNCISGNLVIRYPEGKITCIIIIDKEGLFIAFNTRKKDEFSYFSSQKISRNRFKRVMEPLDYQAGIFILCIENVDINC